MAAYIRSGSLASELTGTPAQNPWAKSRGMDGRVPQNLEQGTLMQIPPSPRFCHVSKIQAPDCLHSMQ